MSVPTNKEDLIQSITSNYEKLRKEFATIPEEFVVLEELPGHSKATLMSINQLVSYLVGWGQLVLKWNEKKDNNEAVDFPETGYKWNELGKLAQKFYEDYENFDFKTLIEKLDRVVDDILSLIESKSNHALYEVNWYEKWALGRMIQFNTSSPYANARLRIRKWKKQRNLI